MLGERAVFVLVIITCITIGERIACQEFPRDYAFTSVQSCERAAIIEKGRYAQRPWLQYSCSCQNGGNLEASPQHNRGWIQR